MLSARGALRWLPAALVVASLVPALAYRSWVDAQTDAVVVLSTTIRTPVLTWLVGALTDEPRAEETEVAGQAATLVRPGHGHRWPAVVFLNGATELGHLHPDVQRLAHGLARAGFLVVVPELPGLRRGEITTRTLATAAAIAGAVSKRPDVRDGRVALLGVSTGASLGLLAARDPQLAGRLTVVAGIAPYVDLREVLRMATTGSYRLNGRLVEYDADPFVGLAIARSLTAGLPPARGRDELLARLERIPNDRARPLAGISAPAGAAPAVRALVAVFQNRDPRRFDLLYAGLPRAVRASAVQLSPTVVARGIRVPVELASAPHDKYFPIASTRAFAARLPHARVTVTSALSHAIAEPSLRHVDDLLRFDSFAIRVLRDARSD